MTDPQLAADRLKAILADDAIASLLRTQRKRLRPVERQALRNARTSLRNFLERTDEEVAT